MKTYIKHNRSTEVTVNFPKLFSHFTVIDEDELVTDKTLLNSYKWERVEDIGSQKLYYGWNSEEGTVVESESGNWRYFSPDREAISKVWVPFGWFERILGL